MLYPGALRWLDLTKWDDGELSLAGCLAAGVWILSAADRPSSYDCVEDLYVLHSCTGSIRDRKGIVRVQSSVNGSHYASNSISTSTAASVSELGYTAYNPEWTNRIMVSGCLSSSLELTTSQSGVLGSTTLINSDGKGGVVYRVQLRDQLAKQAAGMLKSGSHIHVQGRLSQKMVDEVGESKLHLVIDADTVRVSDGPPLPPLEVKKTVGQSRYPSLPVPDLTQCADAMAREEAIWKDLFARPSSYWDNRENKRNPRAPDFKHKDSNDIVVWVSSRTLPEWVPERLSELPSFA
eukprot:gene23376-30637_t